jgi:hypothetical protein
MAARRISPFLLSLVTFFMSLSPIAGFAQGGPGRVVTKTRLQVLFADLENQWLKAVQAKDKPSMDKLLAESFEVWTPTQGDPIPLANWRQQSFSRPPQSFEIRQIAVRGVKDDVAIVSFVLNQHFAGRPSSENQFVVDIWTKGDDGWRCTDRYISPAGAPQAASEDARPNGKQ